MKATTQKFYFQDPTDYAMKHKAKLERAKQIKLERSRGVVDEDYTFAPTVNKRPAYLSNTTTKAPSYDDYYENANIFDKPLPGNKSYNISHDDFSHQLPSPGSDALGKEVKRQSSSIRSSSAMKYNGYLEDRNNSTNSRHISNAFSEKRQSQIPPSGSMKSREMRATSRPQQNRSSKPDWNNNFGTDENPIASDYPTARQISSREKSTGRNYDLSPRLTQDPELITRARSQLSLLKTRIRNSEENMTSRPSVSEPGYITSQSLDFARQPSPIIQSRAAVIAAAAVESMKANGKSNIFDEDKPIVTNSNSSYAPAEESYTQTSQMQCPDCNRSFNPSAFDKHVKVCAKVFKGKGRLSGVGGQSMNSKPYNASSTEYPYDSNEQETNDTIQQQLQCPDCNRMFNQSAYNTHIKICAKVFKGKGRLSGIGNTNSSNLKQQESIFKPNMASYENEFEQQQQYEEQIQCPDCNRSFNASSYDKHIKVCASVFKGKGKLSNSKPNSYQQQSNSKVSEASYLSSPVQDFQQPMKQTLPLSAYPTDSEEFGGEGEQRPCPDCGRKFNPTAYEKHIKICAKVFQNKRKVFDSKKMRIEAVLELNPDAATILKTNTRNNRSNKSATTSAASSKPSIASSDAIKGSKQSKWQLESNKFREAMKAARMMSQAEKTGEPLPAYVPSGPDMSLTQCPHCSRRFNEKAAERHIPVCNSIRAKPSNLKKNSGLGAASGAASTMKKSKGYKM